MVKVVNSNLNICHFRMLEKFRNGEINVERLWTFSTALGFSFLLDINTSSVELWLEINRKLYEVFKFTI